MIDLRTKEQQNKDKKSWSAKTTTTYLGNLPTKWTLMKRFFFKLIKKTYKYIIIIGFSYLLLQYPNEIGTLIGDWSFAFLTGLTNKY